MTIFSMPSTAMQVPFYEPFKDIYINSRCQTIFVALVSLSTHCPSCISKKTIKVTDEQRMKSRICLNPTNEGISSRVHGLMQPQYERKTGTSSKACNADRGDSDMKAEGNESKKIKPQYYRYPHYNKEKHRVIHFLAPEQPNGFDKPTKKNVIKVVTKQHKAHKYDPASKKVKQLFIGKQRDLKCADRLSS